MSYVDDLLDAYQKFVALPWQQNLAGPQRVWMVVYRLFRLKRATCFSRLRPAGIGGYTTTVSDGVG